MIEFRVGAVVPLYRLDGAVVAVEPAIYYTDDPRFPWTVNVRSATLEIVGRVLCSTREEADQTAAVILEVLHARAS